MSQGTASGPLAGLVVIDAAQVIAAPLTATLLGDYGARVIKVEHPERGDNARTIGGTGSGQWWTFLSRNKECVTCNLATPEGSALFKRLVKKADVVIENFRPGTFESWHLSYQELAAENPGLVMLRISGFGQDGPYMHRPGYGALAEASGGLAYMTGDADGPPTLPGVPVADPLAGTMGAAAVMMALWARDHGPERGKGAEIDISLYGPMLYLLGAYITDCAATGVVPGRGAQLGKRRPRGVAQCRDGHWVSYSIIAPKLIAAVMEFLRARGYLAGEVAQDEDGQLQDAQPLKAALQVYARDRDRETVLRELTEAGVPIAPIASAADILADPHFRARGEFPAYTDPGGRRVIMPRPPARFNGDGSAVRLPGNQLGEHNWQVYHDWLGISAAELTALKARKII